jgi:hypothetical protein
MRFYFVNKGNGAPPACITLSKGLSRSWSGERGICPTKSEIFDFVNFVRIPFPLMRFYFVNKGNGAPPACITLSKGLSRSWSGERGICPTKSEIFDFVNFVRIPFPLMRFYFVNKGNGAPPACITLSKGLSRSWSGERGI